METVAGAVRYALRQFWFSRVFTAAAVLTLALGIGGTTAIFTLIHAVMLRSLPVSDPARLYRIGDGDDCCVEGGPQDRWGMFSFPLYERLTAETPEFEEVAAFQAGGARLSVRREDADVAARPLRSEYVTGNYFSTLGIGAFGGRVFTPDNASPGAIEPLVTRTLSEVDPNLTIISVRTMQQQVELSFNQERAVASLAGLFGIVALLLAAVGLYGVTAYTVAQRTNEIGIRMALGADRAKVIDLVLRGALKRVVIGLILGLPLAVGAGRLISSQLYGVSV